MSQSGRGRVACFTSFTFAYLSRARVLAETVRKAHPDWTLHAVIVDAPPPGLDERVALRCFDRVVYAQSLPIPSFQTWLFKHDIVEACTAVKGAMLAELLRDGAASVVYLDPDIAVFHPLSWLEQRMAHASILLTPHQVEANDSTSAVLDNERTSLQYGIFNLGFLVVRNDANGVRFADWWAAQLYDACYDEVESGIFTDQKYCDLAPALFDGVEVERSPGCNVASWNLSRRRLAFERTGGISVNGEPLYFYHFTKIGSVGDAMTERYSGTNWEVWELWTWYKRQLRRPEAALVPNGWWHYGRFANGAQITREARLLFRGRPDLMRAFEDPFAVGPDTYWAWLERHRPDLLAA